MLILCRRVGESVMIGDDVTITVLAVKGNQLRLGFTAPPNVAIHREEVYERIQAERLDKTLRSGSATRARRSSTSVDKLQSSAPSQCITPASHTDALQRLQAVRDLLAGPDRDLQQRLEAVLEAALFVTGAPRGNLQLFDGEGLRIAAQRGFELPFLDFFRIVRKEEDSACGLALEHAQRVMVHDVNSSDIFRGTPALPVLLEAQVRAVVSTPLVSSAGQLMGMVSTHFASPHTPSERELALLDLLARPAANYLERKASEEGSAFSARRAEVVTRTAPA